VRTSPTKTCQAADSFNMQKWHFVVATNSSF